MKERKITLGHVHVPADVLDICENLSVHTGSSE